MWMLTNQIERQAHLVISQLSMSFILSHSPEIKGHSQVMFVSPMTVLKAILFSIYLLYKMAPLVLFYAFLSPLLSLSSMGFFLCVFFFKVDWIHGCWVSLLFLWTRLSLVPRIRSSQAENALNTQKEKRNKVLSDMKRINPMLLSNHSGLSN